MSACRRPRARRCGARFDYEEARIQTLPMKFACPSIVLRDGDTNSGATEVFQPWSEAVAERTRARVESRHARPCAGHPRLCFNEARKDVDGRDI